MNDRFVHITSTSIDALIEKLNTFVQNVPLGHVSYIGPSIPFDPKNPVSAILDYGYVPVITYEDISGINAHSIEFDDTSDMSELSMNTTLSA